jgi:hypothetical protein
VRQTIGGMRCESRLAAATRWALTLLAVAEVPYAVWMWGWVAGAAEIMTAFLSVGAMALWLDRMRRTEAPSTTARLRGR